MKPFSSILVESRHGVARVTLNRPERRNAFDAGMARELCEAFETLGLDHSVRCILLTGAGSAFCAGADIGWMKPDRELSAQQARTDADQLIKMYRAIDECPCPVVARVHGPAFGGGVGLVAACDVAVANEAATFALSEARLGLVPAVIAPFLLRKTGESFVRRFTLTGEPFSAPVARHHNLVHDLVPRDRLDSRVAELADAVTSLAPLAARRTKALLRRLSSRFDAEPWSECVEANAQARLSAEAQEGLLAFLEKRPPAWTAGGVDHGQKRDGRKSHDADRTRA